MPEVNKTVNFELTNSEVTRLLHILRRERIKLQHTSAGNISYHQDRQEVTNLINRLLIAEENNGH